MTAKNPFDFTDISHLPPHVQKALASRPSVRRRKNATITTTVAGIEDKVAAADSKG